MIPIPSFMDLGQFLYFVYLTVVKPGMTPNSEMLWYLKNMQHLRDL